MSIVVSVKYLPSSASLDLVNKFELTLQKTNSLSIPSHAGGPHFLLIIYQPFHLKQIITLNILIIITLITSNIKPFS